MTRARTVFAVLLVAGFAFALGCGSNPEPTQPAKQPEGSPTTQTPTPDVPKAETPKVAHELDQTKHVIPAHPVRGSIGGMEVTPTVTIQGDELSFNVLKAGTPEVERCVRVRLAPMLVVGQPVPSVLGRDWKVKFDSDPGPNVPHVQIELPGRPGYFAQSAYALTLELGQRKDGKVPGKIYLCLLDDQKTVLAGTFEAVYSRSHMERPGSADAPYIGGEITVTGAAADAKVRVDYVAFTEMGVSFQELVLLLNPPPTMSILFERVESSTFVRGERNGEPFRYEHVKLKPGRYLVMASVIGGPAVWKWVDVAIGSELTVNFTLDASKTGGVEVSVPAGVTGAVHIVPANDPSKPALDAEIFKAISQQVMRQDAAVAGGKALLKNLGPGKYEVRVGELKGNVEIVAGKTAELMLTAPKEP
jgi:hypothetical protein